MEFKQETKANHFHIPADPKRLKAEEIKARHQLRRNQIKPDKVTNEMLYELLMDLMEKQDVLENRLSGKL